MAFAAAPTELVLLLDADQLATQSILEWSLRHSLHALARCDIFLEFPRKFPTGVLHPRPHPAAMLASRSSYWRVGGCDEDFGGNYGYTDVHFTMRLKQTSGCRRISANSPKDSLPQIEPAPPLIHLERHHSKHNAETNKALFSAKTLGRKEWSADYLRFSWSKAFDSSEIGECLLSTSASLRGV